GTPRFSCETRRAVGRVAFDDEVLKAVSMTVLMRRKNSSGGIRDSSATDSEYTPNMWMASPRRTVAMNQPRAWRRSSPKRATFVKMRQATAKGATFMIMSTILAVTSYRDWRKRTRGAPRSG